MRFKFTTIAATTVISIALAVLGYWAYIWMLQLTIWMPTPQVLFELMRELDRSTKLQYLEFYGFVVQFVLATIPLSLAGYLIGRYTQFIYWLALTLPMVFQSFMLNKIRSMDLSNFFEVPQFTSPPFNFFWFELFGIILLPLIAFLLGRKSHNKRFNSDAGKARAG